MLKKIMLYLCIIYAPLSGSAVITLLDTFRTTYTISLEYASLALTVYVIPFALFQLFSGAIADAFSKKMSLVLGLGIFGIFGFVIAFAPNFEVLLLARFMMGIMGSFQIPIIISIVGELESENRGREFGLLTIFINLGIALGPFISGIFDVVLSWEAFFFIVGLASIINSLLVYKFLDIPIETEKISFKARSKLTLKNLNTALHNRQVWIFSLGGLFVFTGFFALYVFLPIYLKGLNFTQDLAGFTVSIVGIFAMLSGVIAGKSVDVLGRKKPLLFGLSLAIIIYFFFYEVLELIPEMDQIYSFMFLMAVLGISNAFLFSALNTISNEIIDDLKATVTSLSSSFRFLGFAIIPFMVPIYIANGFQFLIMLSILFMIIGLFFFIPLKTKPGKIHFSSSK